VYLLPLKQKAQLLIKTQVELHLFPCFSAPQPRMVLVQRNVKRFYKGIFIQRPKTKKYEKEKTVVSKQTAI